MQKENSNLKNSLVLQSFAPLFLLLTVKHLDARLYMKLIFDFFSTFQKSGMQTFQKVWENPNFGSFVISLVGICWLLITIFIAIGFKGMQKSGFKSAGEQIIIDESPNDYGATFLVTYVLPLFTDDVDSGKDVVVFLLILFMIISLLIHSNTFYQNPILVLLKYRTFKFKFVNPANDINCPDKVYIGITHGTPIVTESVIKRKYISDGVFILYND